MKYLGIIIIVILIVIASRLIYQGVFIVAYKKNLDKQYEDWYKKEYVEKSFKGILYQISPFEGRDTKLVLSIKTMDEDFTYGVICVDKEFKDFVAEKDSVYKSKGSTLVYFKKINGLEKSYKLEFCD